MKYEEALKAIHYNMDLKTQEEHENEIERVVNEIIDCLVKGEHQVAGEGIRELAVMFKKSGQRRESFVNFCKHIEQTAIEKTGDQFMTFKFQEALRAGTKDKIRIYTGGLPNAQTH